ncbi:hypothetical protein TNIN_455301 [Trichonephila inaurata madagascariensis]|uniref:Uncharacterized protein n=1 Tax=Trichonephila inaurata madagascariensis TaxID=2747483 RepID=A0A8X7CIB2_9ARAC|nr:hypothetical protein TNIN_455301 [Trichonephila inaurata madagascariensis]
MCVSLGQIVTPLSCKNDNTRPYHQKPIFRFPFTPPKNWKRHHAHVFSQRDYRQDFTRNRIPCLREPRENVELLEAMRKRVFPEIESGIRNSEMEMRSKEKKKTEGKN